MKPIPDTIKLQAAFHPRHFVDPSILITAKWTQRFIQYVDTQE